MSERGCSIPDCGNKHHARGYCHSHSSQMYKDGEIELLDSVMRKPLKSNSLRLPDLSPSQEANLCALIRSLPGKGKP